MRTLLTVFCLMSAVLPATSHELSFGGDTYQSTCSTGEWASFEAKLVKAAQGRKPTDMVALAKTYLCGTGEAATRQLHRSMPQVVREVATGSGQDDLIERKARSEFGVLRGEFWGALIKPDEQDVWVSGLVNEVCGHSVLFRYVAEAWLLVEFRSGCD